MKPRIFPAILCLLAVIFTSGNAGAAEAKKLVGGVSAISDGHGKVSLLWFPPVGKFPAGGWQVKNDAGRVMAEKILPMSKESLDKLGKEDADNVREFVEKIYSADAKTQNNVYASLGLLIFSNRDYARAFGLACDLSGVPGGKHTYQITGLNTDGRPSGVKLTSMQVDSSIATHPPEPPGNLSVKATTEGAALYWTPAKQEQFLPILSYQVSREDASGLVDVSGGPMFIGLEWDPNAPALTDTTAPLETEVSYRVTSVDIFGRISAPVPVKFFLPDLKALTPPQKVTAKAGDGEVSVKWEPKDNPHTAGYLVERAFSDVGVFEALTPKGLKQGTSSYDDKGLRGGTTYFYRVRSIGPRGDVGEPSSSAMATPKSGSRPPRPAGLKADVGPTRVRLTWDAPQEKIAGFIVERMGKGAPRWARLNSSISPEPRYDDPMAQDEYGRFSYRVKAVGFDSQEGPESREIEVEIEDASLPPAPYITGVSGKGGKVVLGFMPAAPAGKTVKFAVVRGTSPKDPGLVIGDLVPAKERAFTDSFVEAGTGYWYGVVAFDAKGNRSDMSAKVTVVVEPPDIPVPGRPQVKESDEPFRHFKISFEAPPTGLRVNVQRRAGDAGPWVTIASGQPDGNSVMDPNPEDGLWYRIVYVTANGIQGTPSPEASAGGNNK